jgi:hypothetical protein
MTFIWITYAAANILWQLGVSHLIKKGFIYGDLKEKHPESYKHVLKRSKRKHQSMEASFRALATIGMNMWLLPSALILSMIVLLLQQI